MIGAGDRRVRGGEGTLQIRRESQSRVDDLRSESDELVIPDVEGGERVATNAACACRLQQRGVLAQHAVVVGEHAGQPRGALNQQLISESSARGRVTAHDLQVFGVNSTTCAYRGARWSSRAIR